MDYWGRPKGMLAPPSQIIGGSGPPGLPLFLRQCISKNKSLRFIALDELISKSILGIALPLYAGGFPLSSLTGVHVCQC